MAELSVAIKVIKITLSQYVWKSIAQNRPAAHIPEHIRRHTHADARSNGGSAAVQRQVMRIQLAIRGRRRSSSGQLQWTVIFTRRMADSSSKRLA